MQKISTKEIVYRKDLYPRFNPNQEVIEKYSQSIEQLPPIMVNQNHILIDGFHRWKAHELAGLTEINCEIVQTESELAVKIMAYKINSTHGLQLSTPEKKHRRTRYYTRRNK